MFKNKWRIAVFYIWVVCIPLSLLGGALKGYNLFHNLSTLFLAIGLIGSSLGLIILKTLGGRAR